MKKLGIFSLFLLLVFSACRKDVNDVNVDVTTPDPIIEQYTPPTDNITGSVIGFVVDENNTPVADATVRLNGQTTTTDPFGHFFFDGQTMNALGALVQIEKEGYFDGSRRFFPRESQKNRVKIQLLEKSFDASFSAASGGTVTFDDASVEFFPSSIRTASGQTYNGTVRVAAKWLDPSAIATLDQMPGNLQGVNAQVEQVALGTYGMIAVELESDSGEPLNIADDEIAAISMPVPANMLNAAPAEIPLWSYNEEHGLWVEEGTATLQNGNYVGEVSHFSFWNCDVPYELIQLNMTLNDDDGGALTYHQVQISLTDGTTGEVTTCYGYTDGNGNLSGLVPANEVLTMKIIGACGTTAYSNDIGPFSADTDLGIIIVSNTAINNTTVSGNLIDCNGDALTDGVVLISFDGQAIYHYSSSADFSVTFTTCENTSEVEVIGVDPSNLEQSTAVAAPANATTDLGTISACGIITSYIRVVVDGVELIYVNATVQQNGPDYSYIEAFAPNDGLCRHCIPRNNCRRL